MELTGYILINKPQNITSFQCVNHIKKIINKKIKIGHAGTLDPFATGLLIICIGRQATKSIDTMLNLDKTYTVTAKLGELTDTLDLTGTVIQTQNASAITEQDIQDAIKVMGTGYIQVPPIYSALKHKGKPLYKLVRDKKLSQEELERIVEAKKRHVTLHELTLLSYKAPYFTFTAHVSKGTYIRSLAHDIAQKVGSIATTYELERTAIGTMSLKDAVDLYDLKTVEDLETHLHTK